MSSTIVIIGAAVLGIGAIGAIVMAFRSDGSSRQPEPPIPSAASPTPQDLDPSPLITNSLERLGVSKRIQWHLLQAGLLVRPSELIALTLGLCSVGFAVGLVTYGLLLGTLLAVAASLLPLAYISMRKGARKKALLNQLSDALAMMASSLRSGYSFLRAMQIVHDEMGPPIGEEFGRVLDELNVGVTQESALQHLLDRCPAPDIELVVTACQIQDNVGGNLGEILDTTAGMIRERVRLHGEIAALTAEGRLSAGILAAMPVGLAIVVNQMSPGYLDPLVQTKPGVYLLSGAIGATLSGLLIIKKMPAIQI